MSAVPCPATTCDDAIRADGYRVLARLFAAPPDAGLLGLLAAAPRAADDALGSAWNVLCEQAVRAGTGPEAVRCLGEEYNELFFGVGEPRVMLYGSWYISGSLMAAPLARLRDDLALLGLVRAAGVQDPEDHFAALLEVMAMLVDAGDATQQDFFRRHLASWYGSLCQRLEGEGSAFYRSVARFARGFLDAEAETPTS